MSPISFSTASVLPASSLKRESSFARVPSYEAPLYLPPQLPGRLRDLPPEDLDVIEIAMRGRTFGGALDVASTADIDTARALLGLIDRGWLAAG